MILNRKPISLLSLRWLAVLLAALASRGLSAQTALPPMPTPSPEAVSAALEARTTAPPSTPVSAPVESTGTAAPPKTPQAPSSKPAVLSLESAQHGDRQVATARQAGPGPAASTPAGSDTDEIGYASWYGSRFHGRLTANGEVYDMNKLTAANKTLPFGTIVQVTNLENGKSVEVTINDRGPFVAGRIIDLSRAAAAKVGLTSMGVAKVRLHIVKLGDGARVAHNGAGQPSSPSLATANNLPVIVQLGSFRDLGNAVRLKDFLDQHGFNPLYEKSGDVTRVVLVSVPRVELASVRDRLAKIGINSILVRQE